MLPASPEKKSGLGYWAPRVLQECDQASHDFAADPVHDLRVAIRRCRSMADGFLSVDPDPDWKQMKRLAKPLFSSLGQLRDVQVMAEWVTKLSDEGDPVREFLLQTLALQESELKSAAQHALHAFDRKRWTALNAHLAKRTDRIPLEGLVFQHLALERLMEARELHRRAMRNRSGVAYHQLRIGIKRFRYTVENFLPERHEKWSRDLRDLQDSLGEVHDFDVLRATIRKQPGIEPAERAKWYTRLSAERQKRIAGYRARMLGKQSLWQVWRSDLPSGAALEEAAMQKLRSWSSFLDPDCAHSAQVAKLAVQIFDGLVECAQVRPEYRRVLEVAALLHEVGRSGDGNRRRGRTFRRISKLKPPLGWNAEDLHCVAAVAHYYRGQLPRTSDPHFVGVGTKRRSELLPIIGILRIADALDCDHDQTVTGLSIERQDGTLILHADGLEAMSPRGQRVAGARYLLETICQQAILIRPSLTKPAAPSRNPQVHRRVAAAR